MSLRRNWSKPFAFMNEEDGDITDSITLAENWRSYGHPVMELTEQQYRSILKLHLSFFEREEK